MILLRRMGEDLGIDESYITAVARTSSRFYRHYQIDKKKGGKRDIWQPSPALKTLQYWMVHHVIRRLPVSQHATAYGKGCSIKQNAGAHVGARHILRLDIKDFFPSITHGMLVNHIKTTTLPKELGLEADDYDLISGVCFRKGSLAIGSVCAPSIANTIMYPFDEDMGRYSEDRKLRYTRYADDLVLSGQDMIRPGIVSEVGALLPPQLRLNPRKTAFMGRGDRQMVTGLLLNSGTVSVGHRRHDEIKKMLYQFLRYRGGDSRVILGHLNFLRDIDPITFNKTIQKYSLLFGVNVMGVLRGVQPDSVAMRVAATKI